MVMLEKAMDTIAVAQLPRVATGCLADDVHEHVAEPPRAGPLHPGSDHEAPRAGEPPGDAAAGKLIALRS
jgi:hypothetical protein